MGKTTPIPNIITDPEDPHAQRNFLCIPEPIESWSYLPLFYKSPKEYAFPLQKQVLDSFQKVLPSHEEPSNEIHDMNSKTGPNDMNISLAPNNIDDMKSSQNPSELLFFAERCPFSSSEVFAQVLSNRGFLSREHLDYLQARAHSFASPDAFIYLHCPVDVSFSRIQARNGVGDGGISETYLSELSLQYKKYMGRRAQIRPVLSLDTSLYSAEECELQIVDWLQFKHLKMDS
jgi:deoxyadenosine/deoxycytidine kinase